MAKSKKTGRKKQVSKRRLIAKWNANLEKLGLPEQLKGLPRRRRSNPLLDEDGDELERAAAMNTDGSALTSPEETELRPAVTPGAYLKLAEHFKLSGIARTVLGMRLLTDFTREDVRDYFKRLEPTRVSEAMSAWREFKNREPEIRAFLAGHRRDREVPAKPQHRFFE